MKSVLNINHEQHGKHVTMMATATTELHSSAGKFKNAKKRVNSAASDSSENQLQYDDESYLKYNDITSFRHKTQLAEDFLSKKVQNLELRKKVVASSTSFYEEIEKQNEPAAADTSTFRQEAMGKKENEINENLNDYNNFDNNSDSFYKHFIDNLKKRKLNESKLTNLKHYYTKVRYLNRKHTEIRKNDNKVSKKLINSIELKNNKDLYETSLLRMNSFNEHQRKQQQQQQKYDTANEETFFHESQKALFDAEIKMIGSDTEQIEFSENEEEGEEDDEDEIDEDENENSTDQINAYDPDQYVYNLNFYKQENENNNNNNSSVNNEYKNDSIGVKAIRKYFNIADTPLNLSRKEASNILLNKSRTKLNLINAQSAPNVYLNSNKNQKELDNEYKNSFYKEFTLYRQNEMKNALASGTGASAIKLKQKAFHSSPSKTRSKEDYKEKNKSAENNLTVIATSANNLINEATVDGMNVENNGRFNEIKKKKPPIHADSSIFSANPSLMLSNLIKLRLAQYSTNKIKPSDKNDLMFIIPEITIKKSQSLKIEGISNPNVASNQSETALKKLRTSLKLPSIPNKNESVYHSETFNSSLLITKSLEQKTQFQSFFKSKPTTNRDTNRTPLTISSQLTGTTGITKPKIVTKISENVKKKLQGTKSNFNSGELLMKREVTKLESIKIKNKVDSKSGNNNYNETLDMNNYHVANGNDTFEKLNKSVGEYKYIASSSSRLKRSVTPNELASAKLPDITERQNHQRQENDDLTTMDAENQQRNKISPLKFNPHGFVGNLPPIQVNLHVNNEYNYKSFERVNRNF